MVNDIKNYRIDKLNVYLSKAGKNRNNKCWNQYLTVLNQKHENNSEGQRH